MNTSWQSSNNTNTKTQKYRSEHQTEVMVSILFKDFSPTEYPQLLTAPFVPSNVAYIIFEQDVAQGLRLFPWIGAGLSPFPYFIHRGRLPFYDRSNLMFRHYLFKGIAGGFVAGLAVGMGSGLYTLHSRYSLTNALIEKEYRGDRHTAEKDMDARIVNDALVLRRNPQNVSWIQTTSKIVMLNMAMVVIVYGKGSRLYRALLGGGSGAMISAVVCASGLDTTLNVEQSAPSTAKPQR